MYIEDLINNLNKKIVRFGNIDYYPAITVQDELRSLADECIRWSVDDFKQQAIDKCNGDESVWKQYYNEDMFGMALYEMTSRHDASEGINWYTVDYYLETYCKIKDFTNPYNKKTSNHVTMNDLSNIDDIEEYKRRNR